MVNKENGVGEGKGKEKEKEKEEHKEKQQGVLDIIVWVQPVCGKWKEQGDRHAPIQLRYGKVVCLTQNSTIASSLLSLELTYLRYLR